MTTKALIAATRIVRRRCSRLKPSVKWMKNGITPIGLTIASSAMQRLQDVHRRTGGANALRRRRARALSSRQRAQVAQPGDGARAVPAEQLAVDALHPRRRAERLRPSAT